ncbi:hypothetical protein JCM24511_02040 [Saitozyma sp. JCM 24511]|nr:hypothetical protein JCM24511_02040 [Saitozyma sp. JCM 24511]
MDRTPLRPAAGDLLTSDPHLPEMMRYVQHLVEGPEAEVVDRNAALAYLALITAFVEKGLLQIDWAPRLLIEVGDREFEINLDGPENPNPVSMTLAPPSGNPVDIERGGESQDPSRPSKSKAMALLDALEARDYTSAIRHAASHPKPLLTSCEGLTGEEVDVPMSSASEIKGIRDQLRVLQTLDQRAMTLSVSTNFAYWRLGVAYQSFADRKRSNFCPQLHPRTEQRIIFDLLWDDPDFRLASDLTTQWALKKRLQRGRKFLLLATIFRTNVLHAVPEVSVRRLELVSLEELNRPVQ